MTNAESVGKFAVWCILTGIFLFIMAESVNSFVYWGSVFFFMSGVVILIFKVFWNIANKLNNAIGKME